MVEDNIIERTLVHYFTTAAAAVLKNELEHVQKKRDTREMVNVYTLNRQWSEINALLKNFYSLFASLKSSGILKLHSHIWMFAHLRILFSLVEVFQPWKLENLPLHVDVKWASFSNLFPILIWMSVPPTAFQNNSDEMSSSTSTRNEQAQRALLYIYLNFHRVHAFCRARSLSFHIKNPPYHPSLHSALMPCIHLNRQHSTQRMWVYF